MEIITFKVYPGHESTSPFYLFPPLLRKIFSSPKLSIIINGNGAFF